MITIVNPQDKKEFNRLALHPLQTWEWGEFRQKTGIEVVRLGKYKNNKLIETSQLTIHQLPFTVSTIGYLPKGPIPSKEMLKKLYEVGKQFKCIFIKLEPNVEKVSHQLSMSNLPDGKAGQRLTIVPSPHPLFTRYTFQLDLTKSEEELLKNMHPKTRYNIKVAQKNGVTVTEEEGPSAFSQYLKLLFETTKRQRFFAHNQKYHKLMWETLKPAGMAHLLTAKINSEGKEIALVSWILFLLNGVLYYPYGASSDKFRNVMASNLMMWEAIRFGKKHKALLFDMWGALGPNPDINNPWYGFHRFKQGYNPRLLEFIGSYDLVIDPLMYKFYNLLYKIREKILKLS